MPTSYSPATTTSAARVGVDPADPHVRGPGCRPGAGRVRPGPGPRARRSPARARRRRPGSLRRPAGRLRVVGRDHRDRLAVVADRARQASTGWSARSIPYVLLPGNVLVGEDRATPGIVERARDVDRPDDRARGCALRRVAPHSIPSTHMSDEYSNSPLTFGLPSARAGCRPDDPRPLDVRRAPLARRSGGSGRHPSLRLRGEPAARPRDLDRHLSLVGSAELASLNDFAPTDEQQLDRLRRAEHERRDRITRWRRWPVASLSSRHSAMSASSPASASRARRRARGSVLRRSWRAPAPAVPSAPPGLPASRGERSAARSRPRARRPRSRRPRRRRVRRERRPTRVADRGDARAEAGVGVRAVGDPRAGRAEPRTSARRGARSAPATRRRRATRARRGTRRGVRRSVPDRSVSSSSVSARCVCRRTPRRRASSAARSSARASPRTASTARARSAPSHPALGHGNG